VAGGPVEGGRSNPIWAGGEQWSRAVDQRHHMCTCG
jgi:hypothetical protein